MKTILTTLSVLALSLASCEPYTKERVRAKDDYSSFRWVKIDTIYIHGKAHEMLYDHVKDGIAFTHSPECWCLKQYRTQCLEK